MKQLPIIDRAQLHLDRSAIRSDTGNHTYGDLLGVSESVAAALLGDDNDLREARVAYIASPGDRYVAAQWGVWRAGGVAVPLSIYATAKELDHALADSQATIAVVAPEFVESATPLCQRHGIRLLTLDDRLDTSAASLPEISSDRRAMILYTSGTTSKPKGVVTTHTCIQAQIESLVEAWHWQPDDRIPLFLPLHHIHGIVNILSCALWAGAEVETFPRFDVEAILPRVADRAYTVFMAVPTIYVKLIETLEGLPVAKRANAIEGFAAMRLMVSGSAALPASVHEKWTEITGQQLLERYGMTEIGMALSNPYAGERRPGAVGQPLPGVEVRLRGDAGEAIAEEGVAGEIQVRGPNVFQEYWNQAEATTESFVDGWFRTGDVAVVEDGYYRIMGRLSVDIIKSGGYKISALEIEAVLLDHPAITECAVVGVPDEKWGEAVAVALVLTGDQSLELDTLRDWCRNRMSSYKIPQKLLIVAELSRNAMGKVEKRAVMQLF